jgi:hypothetical protein
MQEEAAQGLFDGQCHQLLLVAMRGVVPTEDDLAIAESDEPVVGDGGAMGVCAEIAQCVLGPPQGRLAYTTHSWRNKVRRNSRKALGSARCWKLP